VYCPRTHAYFGHPPHPWRELLARGGRVALGTDSRASNPDLSLFDELRFLHERFPEAEPQELLRLGTVCGAAALGTRASGRLAPREPADLAIVRLPDGAPRGPFEMLFDGDSRISRTMRDGQWLGLAGRT
jgi:cytosine/adenosine deaminase-related metal-dependent hydrolase